MLAISHSLLQFLARYLGLALSHIGGNHVIYVKGYSR